MNTKELTQKRGLFLKTKKPYFPLNLLWNDTLNRLDILIAKSRNKKR